MWLPAVFDRIDTIVRIGITADFWRKSGGRARRTYVVDAATLFRAVFTRIRLGSRARTLLMKGVSLHMSFDGLGASSLEPFRDASTMRQQRACCSPVRLVSGRGTLARVLVGTHPRCVRSVLAITLAARRPRVAACRF